MGINKKIMVIDQDEDVREILKYNLEKEKYIVSTFENSPNALFAIDIYKPNLILINWVMPEISGLEFLEKIKKSSSNKSIPIIFLICKSEEADLKNILGIDADNYFMKPFNIHEWMIKIKQLLYIDNSLFKKTNKKYNYLNNYRIFKNNWINSNNRLNFF